MSQHLQVANFFWKSFENYLLISASSVWRCVLVMHLSHSAHSRLTWYDNCLQWRVLYMLLILQWQSHMCHHRLLIGIFIRNAPAFGSSHIFLSDIHVWVLQQCQEYSGGRACLAWWTRVYCSSQLFHIFALTSPQMSWYEQLWFYKETLVASTLKGKWCTCGNSTENLDFLNKNLIVSCFNVNYFGSNFTLTWQIVHAYFKGCHLFLLNWNISLIIPLLNN